MKDIFEVIESKAPVGIKRAVTYVTGKPIEELRREKGFGVDVVIVKLASNENPLGPSPKAIEAIRGELGNLHIYPDAGGFRLKNKLSSKLGIPTETILLGNGSENILDLVCRATLCPGDEVVLSEYCFPQFSLVATLAGARITYAPARSDFSQNVDALITALTPRTRLVIVGNPDNPTGSFMSSEDLFKLRNSMPEEAILVVDEAYHGLVTAPGYVSSLEGKTRLNDGVRPVITSRTFSKSSGLAGLRVAYAVMPEALCELISKARLPFNVNSLALGAAEAALDDEEHVLKSCALIEREKKLMVKEATRLGYPVIEGAANFILINVVPRTGRQVADELLERAVIVRPLQEKKLGTFIRVSVGLPQENALFLQALSKISPTVGKAGNE